MIFSMIGLNIVLLYFILLICSPLSFICSKEKQRSETARDIINIFKNQLELLNRVDVQSKSSLPIKDNEFTTYQQPMGKKNGIVNCNLFLIFCVCVFTCVCLSVLYISQ